MCSMRNLGKKRPNIDREYVPTGEADRYVLAEPKPDVKELYVKEIQCHLL